VASFRPLFKIIQAVPFVLISSQELVERDKDYDVLTLKRFGTKYRDLLFKPIQFDLNGSNYSFQYNLCTNPYCKWQGLDQERFDFKVEAEQI
jgi:hypothetical protein